MTYRDSFDPVVFETDRYLSDRARGDAEDEAREARVKETAADALPALTATPDGITQVLESIYGDSDACDRINGAIALILLHQDDTALRVLVAKHALILARQIGEAS